MKVSVIFVNHNGLERTRNAVKSVQQCSPESEIIVVDNNSTDGSIESLRREFPQVNLVPLSENRGFGAGNNKGAAVAGGEFLFFLNYDALLAEDTPNSLEAIMEADPNIGACGPKLVDGSNSFQLSFGCDPSLLNEWKLRRMHRRLLKSDASFHTRVESQHSTMTEVDWVTGAALMIRRDVFQKVGGFDEAFFMYFEDADLCRRIKKLGLRVLYTPITKVVHFGGNRRLNPGSEVALEYRKSELHYYRKHASVAAYFLLCVYLLVKFSVHWLLSSGDQSDAKRISAEVVKISLRGG
jgi:GT2 family glycosyltransferase